MTVAPIFLPLPVYDHPVEDALLNRVRRQGEFLVRQYIAKYDQGDVLFVGRDAAKQLFPEFIEDSTQNNRYADGAASAIADAARRTLLSRSPRGSRNFIVMLTGAPASGKTGSVGPEFDLRVEMQHETILSSLPRGIQLVREILDAGRFPVIRLFYVDDPRINLRRMIRRAMRIGRTVPIRYMAETYLSVPDHVRGLKKMFGSRIDVQVTNNSETPLLVVHHNRMERALYHVTRYTEKSVLEAMHAELDQIATESPEISEAILREARI